MHPLPGGGEARGRGGGARHGRLRPGRGPIQLKTFWLRKPLEFWLEIPYYSTRRKSSKWVVTESKRNLEWFSSPKSSQNFQLILAPELDGAEQAEAAAAIPVHLRRRGRVPAAATGGQFPRRPRGGVPIVKVRFSQTAKIASH